MSEGGQMLSAFAMYSQKRKSIESQSDSKKTKKKPKSPRKSPIQINNSAQKQMRQKSPNQTAQKGSLVNGTPSVSPKNSPVSSKTNLPNAVKKKPIKRLSIKNVGNNKKKALASEVRSLSEIVKPARKVTVNASKVKKIKQKKQPLVLSKELIKKVKIQSDLCTISRLRIKSEKDNFDDNPVAASRSMFEWLIHPLKIDDFFQQNWEKTPVQIKRGRPSYYKFLMSTALLDKVLRDFHILFTKNIDITSYTNGVRETHNPPGKAMPSVVWDYYMNGCSVRMLNPQTYIPKLHALNATLQEFFGCFVGANSYLTPPNSQGFAPHYDDIEAFILQIEGKKRWRLYKPRNENEYLARFSSTNFDQSEIGEPILDTVLNAGDLLYFPRGTIHQGETLDDKHSLHVTLSVYQRNCWGDFLGKLLPEALSMAIHNDSDFREGMPRDYLRYTGFVHAENQSKDKEVFKKRVKELCSRLMDYIDVDHAADWMAKNHIHDFLPPNLTEGEKECSVIQDGEEMTANGVVVNRVEIEPDTRIRLLRAHCARLVEEEGNFRLYYSCENSKEYHEFEPQFLEVTEEFVPAIQEIILRFPDYVRVEDLPIKGEDNKIQIVKDLWEKCVVVTEHPLCVIE